MIVFSTPNAKSSLSLPPPYPSIKRESSLTILGVTFEDNLSVKAHVLNVTSTAAQALYAIKLLKSHGLDQFSARHVCHATIASRLTYAAPASCGFATADDTNKLQAILNTASK